MVSQSDRQYYESLVLRGNASLVGVNNSSGSGIGGNSGGDSNRAAQAPPPSAASAVGARGPSSASSRARRYNRSHVGVSSHSSPYAALNEFPVFTNTGDVEIVVRVRSGHENRYLLHRDTLVRCSGFFEASTSKEWSRPQLSDGRTGDDDQQRRGGPRTLASGNELSRLDGGDENAVSGGGMTSTNGEARRRWRYELDLGQGEHDKPILVQKEAGSSSQSAATPSQSIFGGGGGGTGTGASGPYRERSNGKAAPTHGNPNFFRSVANLALSHSSSSRHHHSRSGSGSRHGYEYGGHGLGNPLYNPPSSVLPPPTPDEIDLLRDYDNLFRIMYNYPPLLDGVNIADAYVQCKSLLAVADEYDTLAIVGPRVDHHLLQFQSRLWRQIAKYPISYLRLGFMARSRVIFQEALVHVVGQWPAGERSLRNAMPDAVLDLIEDKVDELAEAVSRVEARLFRLNLTTRSGERVTPSTAYLDWLAVSLFRQWLADNTTPAAGSSVDSKHMPSDRRRDVMYNGGSSHHHRAGIHRGDGAHSRTNGHRSSSSSSSSNSGRHRQENSLALQVRSITIPPLAPPLASLGRTYRILGTASGSSFLGHDECKRFLKLSPDLYTRDNLRRFEKRIDELKAMAREIVRPLMGSGLELDVSGVGKNNDGAGTMASGNDGVAYLTCTYISDHDLPWLAV